MVKVLIRWAVLAAALVVAALVVPGISVEDDTAWMAVLVMAAVLGLVDAFIRPILAFLSCGCIALTLGLFIFVVNAAVLWLSSWIAVNVFDVGFVVDGFLPALIGGVVVSIVSLVLEAILPDGTRD